MSNTTKLDEIYTREWFEHDFAELQPEFDVVAESIVRQFRPKGVTDIGCGPGMVVRRLRALGVEAWGIDGSRHALEYAHEDVKPYLSLADVTAWSRGARALPSDGLLICTEVAEHLKEEHAAGLVRLLASGMCPIVFTAAGVNQDGHHHVNCQPQGYWRNLFLAHGVTEDYPATHDLQARWGGLKRLSHMTKNVMVFR